MIYLPGDNYFCLLPVGGWVTMVLARLGVLHIYNWLDLIQKVSTFLALIIQSWSYVRAYTTLVVVTDSQPWCNSRRNVRPPLTSLLFFFFFFFFFSLVVVVRMNKTPTGKLFSLRKLEKKRRRQEKEISVIFIPPFFKTQFHTFFRWQTFPGLSLHAAAAAALETLPSKPLQLPFNLASASIPI